jgi:hypothetical protein
MCKIEREHLGRIPNMMTLIIPIFFEYVNVMNHAGKVHTFPVRCMTCYSQNKQIQKYGSYS